MSNLKHIPTAKLKQIIDSHHVTGTTGADYWDLKDELEAVLWERLNRENEKIFKNYMAALDDYEECALLGKLG